MRRAFVIATTASLVCAIVACSGSSADPITGQSSSGGTGVDDAGGGSSSSSGSSGETCPPCEPPPDPSCKGSGPCGCGPYTCADAGGETDSGAEGDCTWATPDPCGPGKYCQTNNCGKGMCVPLGTTETASRSVVCGCDGVTYWNASLAAKHGMSVRRMGECSGAGAATCGGFTGKACPGGARCAHHLKNKNECDIADADGTCWQLPAACPPIAVGARTRACDSAVCADACTLIKASAPYYDDVSCPQ